MLSRGSQITERRSQRERTGMNANGKSIQPACASWIMPLLAPCTVLEGCAGTGPYNIKLMTAPEVFADGVVNLLPRGRPRPVAPGLTLSVHSARRPRRLSPGPGVPSVADPATDSHDGAGGWLLLN